MDIFYEWLRAFGGLWTSPFYYLALLFAALHLRKQTMLERKLFAVKLHSWWSEWWRVCLWGVVVGAGVSALFLFAGAALTPVVLIMLWVVALLLALVRVRYFCFAYAAGVLGVLQATVGWIDASGLPGGLRTAVEAVDSAHMPSVFLLVGVLHIAEAILVGRTAGRLATPLFLEGKRGKPVGGFLLQGFWPVPLLMLVPFGDAGALPWPTLFGGMQADSGWGVLAFPALFGFSSITITKLPQSKARSSAVRLAVYGAVIAAAGITVQFAPYAWAALLAALLCFGLHELIVLLDRRSEDMAAPYYVHDPRGLKVLAVLPGSPAADLGIEPGHIVRKVNGQPVRDRAELHAAIRLNGAFIKLEVLNRDGESRFLQRAVYANEHHQLGLLLCPDERTLDVAVMEERGLFSFLRSRRASSAHRGGSPLALPAPSSSSSDSTARM